LEPTAKRGPDERESARAEMAGSGVTRHLGNP